MKILVTGGAGFIGSAFIRHVLSQTHCTIVNVDKLTYAGNLESLQSIGNSQSYVLETVDICNQTEIQRVFSIHQPDAIVHLAAESHVDRSITGPADFIQTNIFGTYTLLEEARKYYSQLAPERQIRFRFLHVSTDEVYGELNHQETAFAEFSPYSPNSPYSASKASSDHLVRAWGKTYGLPTLTTHCSNNYGPFQFPEKFIPLMILNALEQKLLPVYGKGENIRDWIYVDDHVEALLAVLLNGKIGETYNIGARTELTNLTVVESICDILDRKVDLRGIRSHRELISFVKDRPGHDFRYAIDSRKIEEEIGWRPKHTFASGISKTIEWYLQHTDTWCKHIQDNTYQRGVKHSEFRPIV